MRYEFLLCAFVLVGSVNPLAQHHPPDGQAMGFDQERTAHHFILHADGGTISVEVNDAADEDNRRAIRTHLRQIALDFAAGRFDAPFFTHGEEPPGTAVMRALLASIRYAAEDTPRGARVRLTTTNRAAIAAIHEFLVYQIREHRTGDPTVPQARGRF
jgi:hypothetical protein